MEPYLEFSTIDGSFNFKDTNWEQFSRLIVQGSINLERDAKRCKGKARVDELTASLTTLITDCLQQSTEKVRVCGRSKQWWTHDLKSKLKESRKAKREANTRRFQQPHIILRLLRTEQWFSRSPVKPMLF
ncbi:hypothetical protein, no similarity [Geotrichum candidum]|uniref:Uncharacterized protein n=1 Tax=Geotrichum candidum TaxID=1173061 RepID=A0A0J9YHF7_GEOCN|nr:hypothetical protein, no similarity [Geotrichum candidum]